jgi:ActR/RegA family two-component response regulator
MSAISKGKILILDSEPLGADELARNLEAWQYQTAVCRTGKEALALFKEKDFDLLIIEWRLDAQDGLDGFQVMESVGKLDPTLALVVLTAFPDVDSAVKAMKLGARDYLKKPMAEEIILSLVGKLIEDRKAHLSRREGQAVFEELKRRISSSLNLQEVLDLIAAGVAKGMGVKGCTISLLDKKRDQLKVVAYQGLTQKYLEKGPIDSARSLGEMIKGGQDLYIPDVTKDNRVQYPEDAVKEGITSILSVPLLIKQELIGALRIYTASAHHFSPEEFKFLHGLADQAALAIENARSYEDMKNKYETLRGDLVDYFEDGWT